MTKLRIIFDVHCKVKSYGKLTEGIDFPSLQLGDFGFDYEHKWHMANIDPNQHKVLLGNHDDTRFVHAPHSIGHHGEFQGVFCVRGAFTPHAWKYTLNDDYFQNEELDYGQQTEAYDAYIHAKPRIVVTHDCPMIVRKSILQYHDLSKTASFLQALYEAHQPDLWIFGHHHRHLDEVLTMNGNETRFICGPELHHIDIETEIN